MWTARTSSSIERPTLTAWMAARSTPWIGTTIRSSRFGERDDELRVDRQLASRPAVLAVDEQHHPDQDRDEDDDEVRPVGELLEDDDAEDDTPSGRSPWRSRRAASASPTLDPAASA